MAVRTGTGTGVVVGLVSLVILNVTAIVIAVIFYGKYSDSTQELNEYKDQVLSKYVLRNEQSEIEQNGVASKASSSQKSIVGYLQSELKELNSLITGNPEDSSENTRGKFESLRIYAPGSDQKKTIKEFGSAMLAISKMSSDLQNLDSQLKGYTDKNENLTNQIATLEAKLRNQKEENDKARRDLESKLINDLKKSKELDEELKSEIEDVLDDVQTQTTRLERRKEELEERLSEKSSKIAQLQDELAALKDRTSNQGLDPQNPSMLIDGLILERSSTDTVYIDRGRRDRIPVGITFEVYDDASQLQMNTNKKNFQKGKAIIKVIDVGETTSMAKIISQERNQAIVTGDVLVNPLYDPNYEYSFVIYGNFDANNDGRITNSDAEHMKSSIQRWGGKIKELSPTEDLPGDIDFLVLGIQPSPPIPPNEQNATDYSIQNYRDRRERYDRYQQLKENARQSRVPILNGTRLQILTGYASR